jgi:hypothetical protein
MTPAVAAGDPAGPTASPLSLPWLHRPRSAAAVLHERPKEHRGPVYERAEGNQLFVLELLMLMAKLAPSGACDRKRPIPRE